MMFKPITVITVVKNEYTKSGINKSDAVYPILNSISPANLNKYNN